MKVIELKGSEALEREQLHKTLQEALQLPECTAAIWMRCMTV